MLHIPTWTAQAAQPQLRLTAALVRLAYQHFASLRVLNILSHLVRILPVVLLVTFETSPESFLMLEDMPLPTESMSALKITPVNIGQRVVPAINFSGRTPQPFCFLPTRSEVLPRTRAATEACVDANDKRTTTRGPVLETSSK